MSIPIRRGLPVVTFRPRITISWMMVIVAVVGVSFFILVTSRRSMEYRKRAWLYSQFEDSTRVMLTQVTKRLEQLKPIAGENHAQILSSRNSLEQFAAVLRGKADAFAQKRRKYEVAALRPWRAVEPDVLNPE